MNIFQVPFEEALRKYTEGILTFEQFMVLGIISIRKDIDTIMRTLKDKEQ
jgi:hypothetical protein